MKSIKYEEKFRIVKIVWDNVGVVTKLGRPIVPVRLPKWYLKLTIQRDR